VKGEEGVDPEHVIAFVATLAREILRAKRVLLFGSRARGTNGPRSDYDFAVDVDEAERHRWAEFARRVEDEAPTLNAVDLIDLSSDLRPGLRAAILADGVDVTGKGGGDEA
jgi:predicted nucleotidyltransferase